MSDAVKRTPDQEKAVTLSGSDLLVSASAGSGKTKVLVDRIIHRLINDPTASLSKMLIVTFTNAATAEMKLKIEDKLRDQLAEAGALTTAQRQHLAKEVAQVSAANIMTLDAFSKQVVDHYYYVIDLDPGYRMMTDESEVLLFKTRVWEDLRANIMSQPDRRTAFATLAANFTTKATRDGLQDVVFALYDYAMTTKDPAGYLGNIAAAYGDRDEAWMTDVWAAAKPIIAQNARLLEEAAKLVQGDALMAPWHDSLAQTTACVQALLALAQPSYRTAYDAYHALTYPGWKVSTAKKFADVKATIAEAKALRDQAKAALDDLSGWFEIAPADLEAAMPQAMAMAQTLQDTMLEYDRAMQAEKTARRVQTFGDIAQNALRILNSPLEDGGGHTVGDHYQDQFQEVLVDEYQDINPLQDALLDAVSKPAPGNRFMVGDMKQSIYGFRLADPQKFLARYHQYSQTGADGQLVTLNQNFRSTDNVLAFTNLVFTQIMDQALGDIDYTEAERLHENQGYDYQTAAGQTKAYRLNTEFLLEVQAAPDDQSSAEAAATDDTDESGDDLSVSQARMVAAKIKALTAPDSDARLYTKAEHGDRASHERRVQYSDITLLTRSRTNNLTLQQVFAEADIPVVITKTQNFFKTTELMVMLSLLRIIDNPKQEIPLTAVLRSPIVGLDANDLARIRISAKGPYDEAVFGYAQRPASADPDENRLQTKLASFTALLDELRVFARTHELSALIWHIYEETGFLDIVGSQAGGRQRQANLRALAKRAADYEKGGFKGLFAFVQFIETMQKQDKDLSQPVSLAANVNAVQLMTIHNSKGLQFPIVFLLDTQKAFNTSDLSGAAILAQAPAEQAGGPKRELVGLKWRDPQTFVEYQLPQWQLAKDQKKKQLWTEEMRLLYVALTRAEQQLFIVGTAKTPQGKLLTQEQLETSWLSKAEGAAGDVLPAATRLSAQSLLDWLGMAMARAGVLTQGGAAKASLAQDAEKAAIKFDYQVKPARDEAESTGLQEPAQALPAHFDQALTDWLDFTYADQRAATMTGFQSVTELKRMFEDPDVVDAQDSSPSRRGRRMTGDFAQPAFLQQKNGAGAAAVGTATHLLLQQVPLTGPHDEATLAQLADSLASQQLITPAVRRAMRLDRVAAFFQTALGKRLVAEPANVHREQAFSLLWPAADFPQAAGEQPQSGELEGDVLVHGVIDGFIEEPDGITLFDYKTDHIGDHLHDVIERYQGQLEVYAEALTLMSGKPVRHRYLVLLETGDVHEVAAAKHAQR
ncbi:helicase-exonuclease AddAB subunit AddA [Lacticaseibacillus camelliae]|uniref:DNA 3'-5' helicase n=1 Tax=Lacticaseibacillus camelliae DSM 22697 = JCM 13995 TaxID=1423730 RepID=A0A0R2FAV7_9LACO|nr:helicase-exonuclease AddAB subunit AddA [Lacticaseibacillus camelliae]KRN25491.1 ATP-dependent exoDNAse (exonuclease V) beta subunit [Lacticaseibacillus camelliae DSM 22697 = JCM 13995]